jgi:hypothetical protein
MADKKIKLARQKEQAIDALIHAMAIHDIAKAICPEGGKVDKADFLAHMRKEMPQCFKTLDFFQQQYPIVMRNLGTKFEEEWRD